MKSITYSNQVPRSTVLRRLGKSGLLRKLVGSSVAAFFAMGSLAPFAQAGQVWDGGAGTGNWTDGANWNVDNLVPNFGLGINFAGAVQPLTNINGATAVTSGITFDVGGAAFTINSAAGITNSGNIINNSASNQTINMGVTVGNAQTWQTNGGGTMSFGAVTLNSTLQTTANNGSINLNGAVGGGSGITHTAGTLNLNVANTFTGPLQINGGNVTTIANGLADTVAVTVDGGTWTPGGADTIARLAGGAGGTVNLGANTITTGDANNTAFLGAVNGVGGGLTKQGTGAFTLSGNNGYSGATLINAGTVILGNANALGATAGAGTTTVAANAVLDLGGQAIAENITLNGTGIAGAGALINSGAAASSAGTVTLGSASTIGVAGNSITLSGVISGNQNLTKVGPGTLTFQGGGANTNTATTTVNDGLLQLNKAGVAAIAGPLVIGDNFLGAASVILLSANQIVDSQNVTINSDGNFNRNGFNEGINNLTLSANGATVTGGVGSNVTVNGTLTMTSGNISGSNTTLGNTGGVAANIIATGTGALGANPATIADSLTLTLANHNITVNVGTAVNPTPDLNVTGQITGAGGFTKLGTGIMQVGTANNYAGQTNVNNGILVITGGGGAAGTPLGTVAAGTSVGGTGTILLLNNAFTGAEPITVNGLGFNPGTGPLGNIAVVAGGTGTVNGPVTVTTTNAVISAGNPGSTMNYTGGITKNGLNLIVGNTAAGALTANSGVVNIGAAGNNATGISGTSGANTFNSDVLFTAGTTNLLVSNPFLGATWLNNGAVVNATVTGALPSLVADGGTAATRTALIMDAITVGNFPGANFLSIPAGAIGGTGASILNMTANQAVQFLASDAAGAATSIININNNSILTFGTTPGTPGFVNNTLFSGSIRGAGPGFAVIKDGTNTQIVTGNSTFIGQTSVSGGTLQVGDGVTAGTVFGSGQITVQPGATLDVRLAGNSNFGNFILTNGNGAVTATNPAATNTIFTSQIVGTGTFAATAGGTATFAGQNTYSGGTTISGASTLVVGTAGSAGQAGTGNFSLAGGSTLNLFNLANTTITGNIDGTAGNNTVRSTSAQTIQLNGAITNTGGNVAVTQDGTGTLVLANAGNTYTGATSVLSAGTIQVGTPALPGSMGLQAPATAAVVNAGGTLALVNLNGNALANAISNGGAATSGTVLINSVNNNTLNGNITNAGVGLINVTQSGVGTTILNGAANNYGGVTTINAGILQLGLAGANGAIGGGNIVNNAALVFDGAANTYNNVISGTGTVTKNQNNITQLGGNNIYTGVTTVNAGTLQINTNTALGSTNGGTIVANGATLNLNARNVGAEAVQLGDNVGGATLSNAGGAAAFLLGAVTLANNSTVNTVTAADDITLNGVVSGNFSLTKNGAGTLILNAINNYSGVTQINTGTVQLGNGSALGSIAGNTVVANLASLDLNGQNIGLEGLSLAGPGNGDLLTVGVLQNSNAAPAVVGGPVLLAAASTIGTHAGTITIDGIISGVAASNLTKQGVGTLILNGVNSYDGQTLIQQGILVAGNNAALGSLVGGTTVTGGASLQLGAVTIGAEALNINGAGPGGATGAITQSPGVTSTYGGLITLQSNSTINTNAGSTLNLNGGVVKTDLFLTINGGGTVNVGVLNGGQPGITGDDDNLFNDDLIVDNATTVNLNVANTYEGPTFIRNGSTVNANGANALPTAAGRTRIEMDQAAGNLALGANQAIASLNSLIGQASTVNLNANTLTIGFDATVLPANINGTQNANFFGVISGVGGNIIKDNNSIQTFSGNNNYTGLTNINAGILIAASNTALGATGVNSGTIVANLASLQLAAVAIGAEPLFINGAGPAGATGALTQSPGVASSFAGLITLQSASTINTNPGSALTLSGGIDKTDFNLTINGGGTVNVGVLNVAGPGITGDDDNLFNDDLIVDGATTVNLNVANTYEGPTFIRGGSTLNANVVNALPIASVVPLLNNRTRIEMDAGVGNLALVNAGSNQQIASLNSLNGQASTVSLNANTLTIGFDATVLPANINGNPNANFFGVISGVGGNIIKDNNSTQTFSGNNTYTGLTNINAGILIAGSNNALGAANANALASGTTVANGASLQLAAGVAIGAEALNISGDGIAQVGLAASTSPGALTQVAGGNSTYGGAITVNAVGATISTNGAGTLTLTGGITIANNNVNIAPILQPNTTLNFTGGGTVQINTTGILATLDDNFFNDVVVIDARRLNGAIQAPTTVNLNAASTYEGPTFIRGGSTLNASAPNALPTVNGRSRIEMDGATAAIGGGNLILSGAVGQSIASLNNSQAVGAPASTVALGAGTTLTIGFDSGAIVPPGQGILGTQNANFSGVINGAGNIIKDDNSTQIFSGNNAYTGTTTINGGTLVVNGIHGAGNTAGVYNIGNNAGGADVLAGTGVINLAAASSVNLLAGNLFRSSISVGDPTVAPVASILTITNVVPGNVAINMAVGSTLNVDLFTGAGNGNNTLLVNSSDRLNLTGTLASGANAGVLVVGNPLGLTGFTGGDSWLLVNMAPAGGPGNITGNLGIDNPGVFDGLNDTALNLVPTQVGNFNQVSGVYTVIDTITGIQMANIMGQSVMSAAQGMLGDVNGRLFFLRAGYGERGYDGSLNASLDSGVESGEGDMVGSDSSEWQAYLNANYNNVSIDAVGAQQAGFDSDTWTAGVGFERSITPNFTLGFAANWLESQQDFSSNVGKLDMSGISLSAYGSYVRKAFWADVLYSFGSFDIETNRNTIGFGNANGNTDAMTHAVQFNTGWNFRFQDNSLVTGPIVGVDYMHATVDGFSETSGGLAALRYNSRNYDSLISRVGWSLSKKVDTDFAKITAQVRLSYERQNIKHDNQTSVSLINQPFTPNSAEQNLGQDYMAAGAGLNFQFTPRFGVLLNYQGQFFRQSVQAHFVNIRAGFSF
jgi:fibronectin-binding autotransporter adhesin